MCAQKKRLPSKSEPRKDIPRVALLLETSREVGRGILRGILRYERIHGPWGLYVMPGDLEQAWPAVRAWGGTGIIARIPTQRIAKSILSSRLPTIAVDLWKDQLKPSNPLSRLSELYVDSYAVGRMAAEHLLERKLPHYAYVREIYNVMWSQRREQAFCERLLQAGFSCHIYTQPPPSTRKWGYEQKRLGKWLQKLPTPVGLLASMDIRGRQVVEACLEFGLRVPEDIAIIGVDNDELLCELSDPPMSSVALDTERGGYEAAVLLDQMMSGRSKKPKKILIEPTRVVTRKSTDTLLLADEHVIQAVRFIQNNATRLIQVNDVIDHVGLSRRSLEVRFRRAMGRSIFDMIKHVRLEKVKTLLLDTKLPLHQIADACGYQGPSYLGKVFHREFGVTPKQFRDRNFMP